MQLKAEKISKWFHRDRGSSNRFFAVEEIDFVLETGSFTVLTGRSGSGKTTLLHVLSGLLKPDSGKVFLGETELYALNDAELSKFRNRHIGLIPQVHTGIGTLTIRENIVFPAKMYKSEDGITGDEELNARAMAVMEKLGIADLKDAYPPQLSGGEQRRMMLARTFVSAPDIILADEPTGDLDDENTRLVLDMMRIAADEGTTVLMSTHENEALKYADRIYRMDAGKIAAE